MEQTRITTNLYAPLNQQPSLAAALYYCRASKCSLFSAHLLVSMQFNLKSFINQMASVELQGLIVHQVDSCFMPDKILNQYALFYNWKYITMIFVVKVCQRLHSPAVV